MRKGHLVRSHPAASWQPCGFFQKEVFTAVRNNRRRLLEGMTCWIQGRKSLLSTNHSAGRDEVCLCVIWKFNRRRRPLAEGYPGANSIYIRFTIIAFLITHKKAGWAVLEPYHWCDVVTWARTFPKLQVKSVVQWDSLQRKHKSLLVTKTCGHFIFNLQNYDTEVALVDPTDWHFGELGEEKAGQTTITTEEINQLSVFFWHRFYLFYFDRIQIYFRTASRPCRLKSEWFCISWKPRKRS